VATSGADGLCDAGAQTFLRSPAKRLREDKSYLERSPKVRADVERFVEQFAEREWARVAQN